MSFHGAIRLLVMGWKRDGDAAAHGEIPESRPGAFAAWAGSEPDPVTSGAAASDAPGDACLTADGRPGRLVEEVNGGRLALVCEVA